MSAGPCAPCTADGGCFRAQDDGTRWIASGTLTTANAGGVLESAAALPLPSEGIVDCAAIAAVDSAAVAVLLALKRRANEAGKSLAFINLPSTLRALVDLYDVESLLAAP